MGGALLKATEGKIEKGFEKPEYLDHEGKLVPLTNTGIGTPGTPFGESKVVTPNPLLQSFLAKAQVPPVPGLTVFSKATLSSDLGTAWAGVLLPTALAMPAFAGLLTLFSAFAPSVMIDLAGVLDVKAEPHIVPQPASKAKTGANASLEGMAKADLISNRNAVMDTGYLESLDRLQLKQIPESRRKEMDQLAAAFNPLADDLGKVSASLASNAEALYFKLTLYRNLGGRTDGLSTKLQTVVRAANGNPGTLAIGATDDALTKQLRQIEEISKKLSKKMGDLGLTADAKVKWSFVQEILRNQTPGMSPVDLWNRVGEQIRKPKGTAYTLETFRTKMRDDLNKTVEAQVPLVALKPELFAGVPVPTFTVDHAVVEQVAKDAARARESGHTLGDSYLHRHITPEVTKYLQDNPGVEVRIYDGSAGIAMHGLQHDGFTEVRRLSDNKLTDFQKYIATNPSTGQSALVVVGSQGRAYSKEIAAHFLYGDNALAPGRIKVLHAPGTAKAEFTSTLKRAHLDPDVVMIGNVAQFSDLMKGKGIQPVQEINEPNLFGFVYEVNGKTVLSVKVEPHLYADRAGEFVKAVLGQSAKPRSLYFTGTAGSLRADIKVNDIVIPNVFSDANGLHAVAVDGVQNDAIALTKDAHLEATGVFTTGKLGAVDTIMTEDKAWFSSHTAGSSPLDIVEQEGAGIAQAIKEHRAAKGGSSPVEFHAVYKISDNLVTGEDFSMNEFNRPESRSGFIQLDFLKAVVTKLLGADLRATPTRDRAPTVLKKIKDGYEIVTGESGPGSPKLTFSIKNFESLDFVEPSAAESLLSQANAIASKLKLSEGKFANQADIQRDLANLALDYQKQYGIAVSFSLSVR